MKTVLFAAELGGGFGHARRLLPLIRSVTQSGHRAVLVVRNPSEVSQVLGHEPIEVREAPTAACPPGRRNAPSAVAASFTDILGRAGFDDVEWLTRAVLAWDDTLNALRPAAVVCEFSPFLCLALWGSSMPALVVGHGFILPPPHLERFPALHDGSPTYLESDLLERVGAIARARGRSVPPALPALFAGTAHAVTGLDVLDPYRAHRPEPALGPPDLDGVLPGGGTPNEVFAYLLGDAPSSLGVLRALADSGHAGSVFVRGAAGEHRDAVRGTKLAWLDRTAPMPAALERAKLVVHHGSMLTAEESLVSGRAQLTVPLYLEHLLTARALVSLGFGHVLRPSTPPSEMGAILQHAWANDACASAARSFATAYRAKGSAKGAAARLLGLVFDSSDRSRG